MKKSENPSDSLRSYGDSFASNWRLCQHVPSNSPLGVELQLEFDPNYGWSDRTDLFSSSTSRATGPARRRVNEISPLPCMAWSTEGTLYCKTWRLFSFLTKAFCFESSEEWHRCYPGFSYLVRWFFDQASSKPAFAFAAPSKLLAGRAALEIGGELDDSPQAPKFLPTQLRSFDIGLNRSILPVAESGFRFGYRCDEPHAKPQFISLERRRQLLLPSQFPAAFWERTLCLGDPERDERELDDGWIPGVNYWHHGPAMVSGVPTLVLGKLHGTAELGFHVEDFLVSSRPDDASILSYTGGFRSFHLFLQINPIPRHLLYSYGIIHAA